MERSGELSGAICLKTLVLLGNDLVAPLNCSEYSSVLFVRFLGFVSPFWLLMFVAFAIFFCFCILAFFPRILRVWQGEELLAFSAASFPFKNKVLRVRQRSKRFVAVHSRSVCDMNSFQITMPSPSNRRCSPLPNISTSSSQTQFGNPNNPLQRNAGKFREIQGKNIAVSRKWPIQGISGNSFWGSQMGILG